MAESRWCGRSRAVEVEVVVVVVVGNCTLLVVILGRIYL